MSLHGPCSLQRTIYTGHLKCSRCQKEPSDGLIKMKSDWLIGLLLIQIMNWGILLSVHCITLPRSESIRRIFLFALKTKLLPILCFHLTKIFFCKVSMESPIIAKKSLQRRSWIEKKCVLNSNDLQFKFYLNIDISSASMKT